MRHRKTKIHKGGGIHKGARTKCSKRESNWNGRRLYKENMPDKRL